MTAKLSSLSQRTIANGVQSIRTTWTTDARTVTITWQALITAVQTGPFRWTGTDKCGPFLGAVSSIEAWRVQGVTFVVAFITDISSLDNRPVISCVGHACRSWEFDEWSSFSESNAYVIYRTMKSSGFKFQRTRKLTCVGNTADVKWLKQVESHKWRGRLAFFTRLGVNIQPALTPISPCDYYMPLSVHVHWFAVDLCTATTNVILQ